MRAVGRWQVGLLLVAGGAVPAACDGTDGADGAGGADPGGEGAAAEGGAASAWPAEGRARAYLLERRTDLPDAPTDFTGAAPGDLVLVNARLVAVVRTAQKGLTVPGFFGGGLVDLHARGRAETLREHLVVVGFRAVRPTGAEVARDGSDGGVAAVRVTGVDDEIALIPKGFPIASGPPLSATVVTEYRLAPDDDFLTVTTSVSRADGGDDSLSVGDALYISHPGDPFLPGTPDGGLRSGVATAPHVVHGGIALVADPPNPAGMALAIDNITALLPGDVRPVGDRADAYSRRLYVGDPAAAPAHLAGRVLGFEGVALGALRPAGLLPDDRVEVRGAGGAVVAVGDGGGPFPVPAGAVTAQAVRGGRAGAAVQIEVSAGAEATAALAAPGFATLRLSATGDDGQPLPARALVRVLGAEGAAVVLVPPGGIATAVPAGELRVVVSRGAEYEIHEETVAAPEGGEATVDATLRRSVDTAGALSTDTHIHSIWSPDSRVHEAVRVLSIAAEGVELPVATDHDHVTQYRVPDDLHPHLQAVVGSEVSTADWGHFNAFPLEAVPGAPRQGSPSWVGLDPSAVFADVRAFGGPDMVLTANHPRRGSSAYFELVGWDESVDPPRPLFDTGFDAVEVYNRGEVDSIEDVLVDMARLLRLGERRAFLGVSDSHTLDRFVGHPRTHVLLGADDPHAVSPADLAAAIKAGRTVVTGGPYIEASVGGAGPGETAAAAGRGGSVTVRVRVQAPAWVPVDRVAIVTAEGVVAEVTGADLAAPPAVVRLDTELTVDAADWLYVRADADRSMEPVLGGRTFSVTSPIYLTAPGS